MRWRGRAGRSVRTTAAAVNSRSGPPSHPGRVLRRPDAGACAGRAGGARRGHREPVGIVADAACGRRFPATSGRLRQVWILPPRGQKIKWNHALAPFQPLAWRCLQNPAGCLDHPAETDRYEHLTDPLSAFGRLRYVRWRDATEQRVRRSPPPTSVLGRLEGFAQHLQQVGAGCHGEELSTTTARAKGRSRPIEDTSSPDTAIDQCLAHPPQELL